LAAAVPASMEVGIAADTAAGMEETAVGTGRMPQAAVGMAVA